MAIHPAFLDCPDPPIDGEPPVAPIWAKQRVAYDLGWIACAHWAKRYDLLADMDSPAYLRERSEALPVGDTPSAAKG
jgi:hypothetical protein